MAQNRKYMGDNNLEKKLLENLASILSRDAEQKIIQSRTISSGGPSAVTWTSILETVMVVIICEKLRRPYRQNENRMVNILSSLKQHEREYFYHIICYLALVQTQGHELTEGEFSNQLLQKGYGSLSDLNLYGLIDVHTEHQPLECTQSTCFTLIHMYIQHFLAAINLLKSPVMETIKFVKKYILIDSHADHEAKQIAKNSSMVLRFVFGLASTIFGEGSTVLLQNILKFLTQHINRDAPVIDSRVSILILQCLFEAQENSLYRLVQAETFVRHIFSFDARFIEENVEAIAYYLLNTSSTESKQSSWTIYTHNKHKATSLVKKLGELKVSFHSKTTSKVAPNDPRRIVISNKNLDYLITVLTDVTTGTDSASITSMDTGGSIMKSVRRDSYTMSTSAASPETSMMSLSSVSTDTMSPFPPPLNASDVLSGPYGYLTKEQFESNRAAETTFFFNMVKDFVSPNFQMHCATLVRTQYRKNDHMWFSFPPTMRHSFYECVEITPVVPMHWVKIPQPDGSFELEERFREKFLTSQASVPPSSNEVAELVVLNSHRMERITITPPSGGDPVLISIYRNSDLSENGKVGCDYLMPFCEVQEQIKWKKMDSFSIGKDQLVGRELPLPSKKGTESAEITTSTAVANLKDVTPQVAKQPEPILGSTKLFARPLGEEPDIQVSEQQIKRWGISDFDASLELTSEGELIPDSTHSRSQSYYSSHDRLYHISPVETIGFKSPEGLMHIDSNSIYVLPQKLIYSNYQSSTSSGQLPPALQSYKMAKGGTHGYALIINNICIDGREERLGAEYDGKNLSDALIGLGYKLVDGKVHVNCTAYAIKELFKRSMNIDHTHYDSFMCCILSHGDSDYVYGKDDKKVWLSDLQRAVIKCKTLVGKPKVFFVQACRGGELPDACRVQVNDEGVKVGQILLPEACDVFFGYATSPNTKACRFTNAGSWYIIELCKAFKEYPNEDLMTIVQIAQYNVSTGKDYEYTRQERGIMKTYRQSPQLVSTLIKKLYFH